MCVYEFVADVVVGVVVAVVNIQETELVRRKQFIVVYRFPPCWTDRNLLSKGSDFT